jgi:hypothetical protein
MEETMQVKTMALLLVLASLAGLAPPVRAGSCSHCVFDDDAPMQPAPKRTVG